jgi:hypothetical protein
LPERFIGSNAGDGFGKAGLEVWNGKSGTEKLLFRLLKLSLELVILFGQVFGQALDKIKVHS